MVRGSIILEQTNSLILFNMKIYMYTLTFSGLESISVLRGTKTGICPADFELLSTEREGIRMFYIFSEKIVFFNTKYLNKEHVWNQ